ncbi:hypothetical protein CCH79_00016534 [Gambusia affinis]|uniref:F-BAR domain-containing protein n=1 Tax=Gambusia affinis TaxID=33528 RepID=A0A315UXM0_GAMAF|nr:hypothetical protein CCH79_00016534 [Gambusia affinis]
MFCMAKLDRRLDFVTLPLQPSSSSASLSPPHNTTPLLSSRAAACETGRQPRERAERGFPRAEQQQQQEEVSGMMMEASFDTEESFDDPSCLAPQPPGSVSPAKRQIAEVKETKITINCVTFPLPGEGPEQQLLKPNEWSYCDYFWADRKDPQGAAHVTGFEVLLQKQLKGKQLQKEMAEFIHERIKIEEEYAKNLSKLSLSPLAAQEEGTLGEAWTQLKKSLHDEAEVHLKFSSKLHTEVEKPLLTFRGDNFKKDLKKYDHHIADLRKQLASRFAGVEKARKALADRQKDLEVKTQQLEVKLSNKTEEDIKKARRKSTQAGDDLMRCLDLYNQTQSKWFEEMVTTSMVTKRCHDLLSLPVDHFVNVSPFFSVVLIVTFPLQELEKLEVERVEWVQQHLRQYTTLRHETDMFNQSTVEPVDQLLQSMDPAKDRELWVKENKTGEVRPVDLDI